MSDTPFKRGESCNVNRLVEELRQAREDREMLLKAIRVAVGQREDADSRLLLAVARKVEGRNS